MEGTACGVCLRREGDGVYKGREEGQWVGLVCREGGVCVVMHCHSPLTIPSLLPSLCRSLVLATQGTM